MRISHDQILCQCRTKAQTEQHVIAKCPLVNGIRSFYSNTSVDLVNIMASLKSAQQLAMTERILSKCDYFVVVILVYLMFCYYHSGQVFKSIKFIHGYGGNKLKLVDICKTILIEYQIDWASKLCHLFKRLYILFIIST